MSAFSSVAELGTAELPDPLAFNVRCEPGIFAVTGRSAALRPLIESTGVPGEGAVAELAVAELPSDNIRYLVAAAGSYAVTGGRVPELLTAASGSFAVTGVASGFALRNDAGSYAIAGQPALFSPAITLAAGAYSVLGQSASLQLAINNLPFSGEGAVAEFSVTELPPFTAFGFAARPGSYGVVGQAAAFTVSQACGAGAFVLTGGQANLAFAHPPGAYSVTGQPVDFAGRLAAAAGPFILAGGPANLAFAHPAGSYVVTGQPLVFTPRLTVDAGAYVLTGQDVFTGIRALAGAYAVTGQATLANAQLAAEAGLFALIGQNADLLNIFKMYPDAGTYILAGQDAGRAYTLGAETGPFIVGGSIGFGYGGLSGAGAYLVSGGPTAAALAFKLATGQFTLVGWNVVDALGPSGDHIFLIEVQYHDGTQVQTAYLGTDDFTSAPTDSPANQYYASRVNDPGNFERMLFSQGETRGRSTVGAGAIKVNSGDPGNGDLIDDWLGYGWSGREIKIKALPRGAQSLAAASTLFVGRVDRLTATRPLEEFALEIADRLADLDRPLLTTLFAGTTISTAATAEGNADLKGQIKQRCYGSPKQVPLQPANPYDLIYLASVGSDVQSVVVYDGGVALTYDGANASIADLRSASIAAGHYRRYQGYVRLGGTPTFTLFADVVEGATAADRTAAQIARRMLLDFGIPSNEIITGAFDALDDVNDAPCGYFVNDDRTALTAAQDVLDSIGAWLAPGRDGSFATGRHDAPVASTTGLIFDVESQSIGNSLDRVDGEIPVYRVTVQYARVHAVQNDSALAGSVTAERRAYLASEWRSVVAEDLSVKTKHLNAREIVVTTFLDNETDAQTEATRLLAIYGERERYDVTLPLSDAWAGDVGLSMTLVHPRLGFAAGKAFSILGRVDDYATERVRFNLWG